MLWRRLDGTGLDSARVVRDADGFLLQGGTVRLEDGKPCHLRYEVHVDARWRSRSARVRGHLGARDVDMDLSRSRDGVWQVNGRPVPATRDCADVDLGFTPATNLLPVRRLRLKVGASADAPGALLTFPALRLARLPQTYKRLDAVRYAYEAPSVPYKGTLEVDRVGWIVHYPGLFERLDQGR